MSDYLNKTLIDLIPKCIDPETVGNFIPISLCNTIYKVVIKIIVNRVRPLPSNIVSPYQVVLSLADRGVIMSLLLRS